MNDELSNDALMLARGRFSTVRAQHEDEKKKLAMLCSQMGAIAPQILRYMQPDNDDTAEIGAVLGLLSLGRETLDRIEDSVSEIEVLSLHRSQLKKDAWGK